MKGEFNCRCACCVYWRRHVHRVAANKDKEISKLIRDKVRLNDEVIYWKWHHDKMQKELSDKEKTIKMLNSLRKKGFISKAKGWFM